MAQLIFQRIWGLMAKLTCPTSSKGSKAFWSQGTAYMWYTDILS